MSFRFFFGRPRFFVDAFGGELSGELIFATISYAAKSLPSFHPFLPRKIGFYRFTFKTSRFILSGLN
jgi:hypothetical protein